MLERFLYNFLEGFVFLFKLLVVLAIAGISVLPFVFVMCCEASALWLITYLFIIPVDYAVFEELI
jgi:hypothetical protein